MDEDLPQEVVSEELSILLLDCGTEVTMLAVLHDNADGLLCDKTVVVAYYEVAVNLRHYRNLLHRLKRCILRQHAHINFLYYIVLIGVELAGFISFFHRRVHIDPKPLFLASIFFHELRIA